MERPSNEELKELLNGPWLSVKDIQRIYLMNEKSCRKMFKEAKQKALDDNYFVPTSRPAVVPTKCIRELYPIAIGR